MDSAAVPSAVRVRKTRVLWVKAAESFLALVFPFLLVMINARLVMSPLFLQFEYRRPGFPEDYYGLTQEDRLRYAPITVEYLLNGADITYLGNLQFPDGTPLFNARELRHMQDVKLLTQSVFWTALAIGSLALACGFALARRSVLRRALSGGGILTLGIVAAIVIVAVLKWEYFFTGFHTLFFEDDTWYFAYSDTLIRLFPEQFWFDAALVIGSLTTLEALFVIIITWFHRRTSFDSTVTQ